MTRVYDSSGGPELNLQYCVSRNGSQTLCLEGDRRSDKSHDTNYKLCLSTFCYFMSPIHADYVMILVSYAVLQINDFCLDYWLNFNAD